MATKTINSKITLRNDTKANWETANPVLLKGEIGIEIDNNRFKIGDGISSWSTLKYVGAGMIVSDTDPTSEDTYAVGTLWLNYTANKLFISVTSTSWTKLLNTSDLDTYNTHINNSEIHVTQEEKNNWNATPTAEDITYTANGNISSINVQDAIEELDSEKAPKANPTFTGEVTVPTPTADGHATNKEYVDDKIANIMVASDAMVFRGTLGTDGTITALPTTNVSKGDTYKVVSNDTFAGQVSKIGDLFISLKSGDITSNADWSYVPSGNENETTIKIGTSPNISTTAQTGNVILGDASAKTVDTSITDNSTSTNLPTSNAIANFINSKRINGITFTGSTLTYFTTCSTEASTAGKTVNLSNFTLDVGAEITVKFTITNTADNPTLSVNNTTAKNIYYKGSAISASLLKADYIYRLVYDGTNWNIVGDIDVNTGYKSITVSNGLNSTGTTDDTLKIGITSISTDLFTQGTDVLVFNGGSAQG